MADTKISTVLAALQAQGLEIGGYVSEVLMVGNASNGRLNDDLEFIEPAGYVYSPSAIKRYIAKEYMCEYCTTANAKENTTCSQCGAPRSFVIG